MEKITLNEKQKRILFNGRTLAGEFRRGWWKKADVVNVEGCPEAFKSADLEGGLWYAGCMAIKATKSAIVVNTNVKNADIELIANYIAQLNNKSIEFADLGKASRACADRTAELLI